MFWLVTYWKPIVCLSIGCALEIIAVIIRARKYPSQQFIWDWKYTLLMILSIVGCVFGFGGFCLFTKVAVHQNANYSIIITVLALLSTGIISGFFTFSFQETGKVKLAPHFISIGFIVLFYGLFGAVSFYIGKSSEVHGLEGVSIIVPGIMCLILIVNCLFDFWDYQIEEEDRDDGGRTGNMEIRVNQVPPKTKLANRSATEGDSSAVMSVVGIHATIISILLGLGITYTLYINTQLTDVETQALNTAEAVNHIRFSRAWFRLVGPSAVFLESWPSTDDQVQARLAMLWVDPTDQFSLASPFKVYGSKFGLNHTEYMLCLMGALALKYPFPERMVTFGGNHIALQPVPIVVFSDMNELEKWRRLVEEKFRVIAANIRWFGPDPFIQGFNWNEEISLNQKFWKNGLKPYGSQTVAELRELPKEFCSNVESIYDIAGSLDYKLKRFDYLKKLRPSRGIVLVTLIGSVLTFFCGVVIPLIHPKVPRILVVWVPAIFYSYFLLYLTIKISVIIR